MIWRWDREKHITRAHVDMSKMPEHPYDVTPLRIFPNDVGFVSKTAPQDFMEVGSFIFVSKEVKVILEAHSAAVQLFPVMLTYRRKDLSGWFYLRLLKEADCLDREKTIRAGSEDAQPELIKRLVLNESACESIPLFRIGDSSQIGVSDELASAIRRAKCTGVIFLKPAEWRNAALYYQ